MPKRTDSTQKEIVQALRRCGVFVFSLHAVGKGCPDLLLSYRGKWTLAECKTANGKLTPAQRRFRAFANAPVIVLTDAMEAAAWVGSVSRET